MDALTVIRQDDANRAADLAFLFQTYKACVAENTEMYIQLGS